MIFGIEKGVLSVCTTVDGWSCSSLWSVSFYHVHAVMFCVLFSDYWCFRWYVVSKQVRTCLSLFGKGDPGDCIERHLFPQLKSKSSCQE